MEDEDQTSHICLQPHFKETVGGQERKRRVGLGGRGEGRGGRGRGGGEVKEEEDGRRGCKTFTVCVPVVSAEIKLLKGFFFFKKKTIYLFCVLVFQVCGS